MQTHSDSTGTFRHSLKVGTIRWEEQADTYGHFRLPNKLISENQLETTDWV